MKLTEHFSLEEFSCRCGCGETVVDFRLITALEAIRTAMSVPVRINSGYRCASHNAAVGGAVDSRHVLGQAADCSGVDLERFRNEALKSPFINGIGADRMRGFVHVDVRNGPRVEWGYRDGKPVPL